MLALVSTVDILFIRKFFHIFNSSLQYEVKLDRYERRNLNGVTDQLQMPQTVLQQLQSGHLFILIK